MRNSKIRMALAIMSGRKSPDSLDSEDLKFLDYSWEELKYNFPRVRDIQIRAEEIVLSKIEFLEDELLELITE